MTKQATRHENINIKTYAPAVAVIGFRPQEPLSYRLGSDISCIMAGAYRSFILALCVIACAAQPLLKLPVMKELPAEELFRVEQKSKPFLLECVTEGAEGVPIKYSWHKNDQPFDYQSNHDIVQRKNEGSLVFLKPKPTDEGQYQCFAESDSGTASSRVVTVRRAYLNVPKVTPVKHKPVEGKPFKLECPIPEGYPKPNIVWMYQASNDPSISHTVLDRRITTGPDGTLYFSSVTKEDVSTGFKFVCQASSSALDAPVSIAEHFIEEIVANKQPDGELVPQYVSKDMTVKAGEPTFIYCIYGGTPLLPADYTKDGKDVNGDNPGERITRHNRSAGKRLLIREVMLEDQGKYTCKVDNGVGKPQESSMFLTVESAPEFVKKPEKQMIVKEGQDITIPCHVKGVKGPILAWTYNGKPLPTTPSDRHDMKITGSTDQLSVVDLIIKNVQKSDNGYYGCRATNQLGDIYSEVLLHVS